MDSEFDHAIGYTCTDAGSLLYHPNGNEYIYTQGATLVVSTFASVDMEAKQIFLRGHNTKLLHSTYHLRASSLQLQKVAWNLMLSYGTTILVKLFTGSKSTMPA